MSRLPLIPVFVLLLLYPAFPQTHAVLRSNGAVKINGSSANSSTVVMEGDRIDTDQHASANLLLPGRMITVGAGSSVVYKNGSVTTSAGVAKVADTTCQGTSCTTSSALLGSGEKKKCMSPKKPHKDKDCDTD